jgi:hypothetical protein
MAGPRLLGGDMGPEARVIGEAGRWRRGPVAERACKSVARRGWRLGTGAEGWMALVAGQRRQAHKPARMVGAQAVGRVGV